MDKLIQKKANRFRFLKALYQEADGSSYSTLSKWELGKSIGLDREATSSVAEYLVEEHLVEGTFGAEVRITHDGIVEVEQAISEPEKPTQYFPAVVNITNVHSMTNSQIQQGSHGSHQSLMNNPADLASIEEFLREFSEKLDDLNLSQTATQEVHAEVMTIEAQLSSPKPKQSIIREGLYSLRKILEGAGGTAIASTLLPQLHALIAKLGS